MLKWNFKKRKNEAAVDRFGLDSMSFDDLLSLDKVKVIQKVCANCGEELENEKSHPSLQWKDDMRFICKVCDNCYKIELDEQAKYSPRDT